MTESIYVGRVVVDATDQQAIDAALAAEWDAAVSPLMRATETGVCPACRQPYQPGTQINRAAHPLVFPARVDEIRAGYWLDERGRRRQLVFNNPEGNALRKSSYLHARCVDRLHMRVTKRTRQQPADLIPGALLATIQQQAS